MPEKGWYSLTVREETARRVREMAGARGLTVDQLINELLTPALELYSQANTASINLMAKSNYYLPLLLEMKLFSIFE